MSLTGKQKRFLRALGNPHKPTIIIGHTGISTGILANIIEDLGKTELVKVKVNKTCGIDRKEAGPMLAEQTGSELVQIFGGTVLLYKAHPDEPQIKLPTGSDD